jgi:hypothetical protein
LFLSVPKITSLLAGRASPPKNGNCIKQAKKVFISSQEGMKRTKVDIQGLRAIWEERQRKLAPLKMRAKQVRQEISDMFAELSMIPAEASVDYSMLMAAGKSSTAIPRNAHLPC